MRRVLLTFLLLAGVSACTDAPTSPKEPLFRPPNLGIFDGANASGNPGFFFLPPLVSDPSGDVEFGDSPFASGAAPTVRICELDATTKEALPNAKCVADVVVFETAEITADPTSEQFHVNWHTNEKPSGGLLLDRFYRLRVFTGAQELGFADIDPMSAKELKNARTGDLIPLVDGRTLPIKFRIEEEAPCEHDGDCAKFQVTRDGGSFVAPSGHAGTFLPPNVLPPGMERFTLTIERLPVGADNRCHSANTTERPTLEFEGCFRFTSDPDIFAAGGFRGPNGETEGLSGVIVGICREAVPQALDQATQLYKSDPDERGLQVLADANPGVIEGFDETCTGFTGTAPPEAPIGMMMRGVHWLATRAATLLSPPVAHAIDLGMGGEVERSDGYSNIGHGTDGVLSASAPLSREVEAGSTIPVSVHVESAHGAPSVEGPITVALTDVPVSLTVSAGGGSLRLGEGLPVTTLVVWTDAAGDATASWTVPSTPGVYIVTATVEGTSEPLTFTATVAADPVLIFGATFGSDVVDAEPGSPDVGSWQKSASAGTITVRSTVGDLTDRPVELSQQAGQSGGVNLRGLVSGTAPASGKWVAEWKSLSNSASLFFAPVTLRDVNGTLIAALEYRPNGFLTYNGTTLGAGEWSAGQHQQIAVEVNLGSKTTSLRIGGSTVHGLQNVPFFQSAAANLGRISMELGGTSAQVMAWDDILIREGPFGGSGGVYAMDGAWSEGEYGGTILQQNFLLTMPDETTTPATIIVTNDSRYLYITLRFEREVPDAYNRIGVVFDHDGDGETDEGEDYFIFRSDQPNLIDGFATFTSSTSPCTVGVLCQVFDTQAGGTIDGGGAFANDGQYSIIETARPLDSADDAHDFSLRPGDVIRMRFSIFVGSSPGAAIGTQVATVSYTVQ